MAKGFGGMGEMGGFMREAQKQAQSMQKRMAELQADLKQRVYDGSAGGGKVVAHANGLRELLAIKISPDVVDSQDVEMLEDLVTVAVQQAMKKAEQAHTDEMTRLTGGLGLPGMF